MRERQKKKNKWKKQLLLFISEKWNLLADSNYRRILFFFLFFYFEWVVSKGNLASIQTIYDIRWIRSILGSVNDLNVQWIITTSASCNRDKVRKINVKKPLTRCSATKSKQSRCSATKSKQSRSFRTMLVEANEIRSSLELLSHSICHIWILSAKESIRPALLVH